MMNWFGILGNNTNFETINKRIKVQINEHYHSNVLQNEQSSDDSYLII